MSEIICHCGKPLIGDFCGDCFLIKPDIETESIDPPFYFIISVLASLFFLAVSAGATLLFFK